MAANDDVMTKKSSSGPEKASSRFAEPAVLGRSTRFHVSRSMWAKTRSSRTMAPLTTPATGGMSRARASRRARTASALVTSSLSIRTSAPRAASSSRHRGAMFGLRLASTTCRAPRSTSSRHKLYPRSRVSPTSRYVLSGRNSAPSTTGRATAVTLRSALQSSIWNGCVGPRFASRFGTEIRSLALPPSAA